MPHERRCAGIPAALAGVHTALVYGGALVSGPLAGLLLWCVPHFLWGAGNGLHLLIWMAAVTAVLAVLVLIH